VVASQHAARERLHLLSLQQAAAIEAVGMVMALQVAVQAWLQQQRGKQAESVGLTAAACLTALAARQVRGKRSLLRHRW
jgi:hypothetical protein